MKTFINVSFLFYVRLITNKNVFVALSTFMFLNVSRLHLQLSFETSFPFFVFYFLIFLFFLFRETHYLFMYLENLDAHVIFASLPNLFLSAKQG